VGPAWQVSLFANMDDVAAIFLDVVKKFLFIGF
jgi:hypothetical protein